MSDKKILFSNHAVVQMFNRNISIEDVKYVLNNGIIVNQYPDDRPYPSKLLFAKCNNRSLHVLSSENEATAETIIITAYIASDDNWENDFVTRKK